MEFKASSELSKSVLTSMLSLFGTELWEILLTAWLHRLLLPPEGSLDIDGPHEGPALEMEELRKLSLQLALSWGFDWRLCSAIVGS